MHASFDMTLLTESKNWEMASWVWHAWALAMCHKKIRPVWGLDFTDTKF